MCDYCIANPDPVYVAKMERFEYSHTRRWCAWFLTDKHQHAIDFKLFYFKFQAKRYVKRRLEELNDYL